MEEINPSQDRSPGLEPSIETRQEALRSSLQARRPPEPTREFSTLVERSEAAPDPLELPMERRDFGWMSGMCGADAAAEEHLIERLWVCAACGAQDCLCTRVRPRE